MKIYGKYIIAFLTTLVCFSCGEIKKDRQNIELLSFYTEDLTKAVDRINFKDYQLVVDKVYADRPTKALKTYKDLVAVVNDDSLNINAKFEQFELVANNPIFYSYPTYYKVLIKLLTYHLHLQNEDYINAATQLKLALIHCESDETGALQKEVDMLNSTMVYLSYNYGFKNTNLNFEEFSAPTIDKSQNKKNTNQHVYDYNNCLDKFSKGEYSMALSLINQSIDFHLQLKEINTPFLLSCYSFKMRILLKLGDSEEAIKIVQQIDEAYLKKEFATEAYEQFYLESLYAISMLNLDDVFNKWVNNFKEQIPNNCANQFKITLLYLAIGNYHKVKGNYVEEKKALIHGLDIIKCPTKVSHAFYSEQEDIALHRLKTIDSLNQNYKDSQKWLTLINEKQKSSIEAQDLLQKYTENSLGKEIRNTRILADYQDQNLNNMHINMRLIAILSIGLAILSVVFMLQRRDLIKKTNIIANKNDDLEGLNEKLQESNQRLSSFNRMIAHDIKTPLNTIIGFSKRILKANKKKLDPNFLKLLDIIIDSGQNLSTMLNNLLEFSEASIKPENLEQIEITVVVDNVKKMLLSNQKIPVKIEVLESFPKIFGVQSLIEQVFLNLISNAIKFRNKNGGCSIKIYKHQQNNHMLTIAIKDNGIGIEQKYHHQIFEFAKKLHGSREYEGSGIGLSTVKKIVEGHGGKIWLESEVGKGTTFYFSLPLYRENQTRKTNFVEEKSFS